MSFKNELHLKVIGAQAFVVVEPLVYVAENGMKVTVKKGFDFDGASVPQAFWSFGLSPMTGKYQRSACLHDALYAGEIFDRAVCDALFLEAMKSEGVGYVKRYAMYSAVRAFGWMVWKKHKPDEVKEYKEFVCVEN